MYQRPQKLLPQEFAGMNRTHPVPRHTLSSMVVDDCDVPSAVVSPAKTDSPLVIDADAVLSTPATAELLQSVAWRHTQVVQVLRAVEHL